MEHLASLPLLRRSCELFPDDSNTVAAAQHTDPTKPASLWPPTRHDIFLIPDYSGTIFVGIGTVTNNDF